MTRHVIILLMMTMTAVVAMAQQRYSTSRATKHDIAFNVMPERVARFEVDGLVYSNWDAPWVTLDSCLTHASHVMVPDSVAHNGRYYKVIEVGTHAFSNCEGLVSVSLPAVQGIIKGAFKNCPNLRVIELRGALPPAVGVHQYYGGNTWDVFERYHGAITTVVVPEGSEADYRAAQGWSDFEHIGSTLPALDDRASDVLLVRIVEVENRLQSARDEVTRLEAELKALRQAAGR